MSKSLNNYIGLLEPPEIIWEKLRTAATDVHRVRRSDPGHPEECNIFTMHRALSPQDCVDWAMEGCQKATIGCIDCKRELYRYMMEELGPIQEKARELKGNSRLVAEALLEGARRCREIASSVMDEVRSAAGLLTLEGIP
jgi:tryptophanyl-tRNA synthetase